VIVSNLNNRRAFPCAATVTEKATPCAWFENNRFRKPLPPCSFARGQMSRLIAFTLLGLISGGVAYSLSQGNILLGGVVGAIAASLGFAKEILEPVKQVYEIRKLKLEIAEKERQLAHEQGRIVLPTRQDIKDHGTPYRIIERDIPVYSKNQETLSSKTFVSGTEEIKIGKAEEGR